MDQLLIIELINVNECLTQFKVLNPFSDWIPTVFQLRENKIKRQTAHWEKQLIILELLSSVIIEHSSNILIPVFNLSFPSYILIMDAILRSSIWRENILVIYFRWWPRNVEEVVSLVM